MGLQLCAEATICSPILNIVHINTLILECDGGCAVKLLIFSHFCPIPSFEIYLYTYKLYMCQPVYIVSTVTFRFQSLPNDIEQRFI